MSGAPVYLGLDHVQVAAPKGCEAEARAFYGEILGLPEIPKPPALLPRGGCWFQCGAQQIHIGVEAGNAFLGLTDLRAQLRNA